MLKGTPELTGISSDEKISSLPVAQKHAGIKLQGLLRAKVITVRPT